MWHIFRGLGGNLAGGQNNIHTHTLYINITIKYGIQLDSDSDRHDHYHTTVTVTMTIITMNHEWHDYQVGTTDTINWMNY